jgi:hypothetical protein
MNEVNTLPPLEIQLNKLFLWIEAERYYLYPQYLSANVQNLDATYTKNEVRTEVFERLMVPTEGEPGKLQARRGSLVYNVFGLDVRSPDAVRLQGINLFVQSGERSDGTALHRLSSDGRRLIEAYRQDPEGQAWRSILAQALAKYELRTRILLYYLGSLNFRLEFSDTRSAETSFFSYPARAAQLVDSNGLSESISIFRPVRITQGEVPAINTMMRQYLDVAVGPHWLREIQEVGLFTDRPWTLQGARGPEPSDNEISVILKGPLTLFRDLGILRFEGGAWTVDTYQAWRHLGADACEGLLPEPDTPEFRSVLEHHYRALLNEDRVVQAALLALNVCEELGMSEAEFDQQLRQLIYDRSLRVGQSWRGQQRHGRGLLGDVDKQFVELLFA